MAYADRNITNARASRRDESTVLVNPSRRVPDHPKGRVHNSASFDEIAQLQFICQFPAFG